MSLRTTRLPDRSRLLASVFLLAGACALPARGPIGDVYSSRLDASPIRVDAESLLIRLRWESRSPVPKFRFGQSTCLAPDLDDDGTADLLLGGTMRDVPSAGGALFVVSGATGRVVHWRSGGSNLPNLGVSLAEVGDWTGDGQVDFAAGCPGFGDPGLRGSIVVYDAINNAMLTQRAAGRFGDWFGASIAPIWSGAPDAASILVGCSGCEATPFWVASSSGSLSAVECSGATAHAMMGTAVAVAAGSYREVPSALITAWLNDSGGFSLGAWSSGASKWLWRSSFVSPPECRIQFPQSITFARAASNDDRGGIVLVSGQMHSQSLDYLTNYLIAIDGESGRTLWMKSLRSTSPDETREHLIFDRDSCLLRKVAVGCVAGADLNGGCVAILNATTGDIESMLRCPSGGTSSFGASVSARFERSVDGRVLVLFVSDPRTDEGEDAVGRCYAFDLAE